MKIVPIPDAHLKNLFGPAGDILEKLDNIESLLPENERQQLGAAFLGDLVDDWGQEENLDLYEKTFDQAIEFVKRYQEKYELFFCLGNHDMSYPWGKRESGFSVLAQEQDCVRLKLKELRAAFTDKGRLSFIHVIDNCIFSHAGLSWGFVQKHADYSSMDRRAMLDDLVQRVNERADDIDSEKGVHRQSPHMSNLSRKKPISIEDMWNDESPVWVRMQKSTSLYFGDIRPYYDGRLQVVGHTPVERPLYEDEKGLLSLDTFSTYQDGSPVGNRRFVVIDTKTKVFQYADEIIANG